MILSSLSKGYRIVGKCKTQRTVITFSTCCFENLRLSSYGFVVVGGVRIKDPLDLEHNIRKTTLIPLLFHELEKELIYCWVAGGSFPIISRPNPIRALDLLHHYRVALSNQPRRLISCTHYRGSASVYCLHKALF